MATSESVRSYFAMGMCSMGHLECRNCALSGRVCPCCLSYQKGRASSIRPSAARVLTISSPLAHLQHRQKCLLGYIHAPDALHALFAFFLFFQQFAFAGDIAAVAFRQDVFADGVDRFASDNFRADRSLNGDLK